VWQKNCEPATNVSILAKFRKRHGKRLKTTRQKFLDIMANVCERHGKSLCPHHSKSLNTMADVEV